MAVPHFFVDAAAVADGTAVLAGEQARHLSTVLRARPGDRVTLADGAGTRYQARVAAVGVDVSLAVTASRFEPQPAPRLTVVHALPKGRKLDEVVQRLTELGVDRIVGVHSERSQLRLEGDRAARARARWQAVALAAAKQSRRVRLPLIDPVGQWRDVFADLPPGVVLWEEATEGLRGVLERQPPTPELTLAVGPEGGLTAAEVEAAGLAPASLGPTVLRTETAALVAVSSVLTIVGRLG